MNNNYGTNAHQDYEERKRLEQLEQEKHDAEKARAQKEEDEKKSSWVKDMESTQSKAQGFVRQTKSEQEAEDAIFSNAQASTEEEQAIEVPMLGINRLREMKQDNADEQKGPSIAELNRQAEVQLQEGSQQDLAQVGKTDAKTLEEQDQRKRASMQRQAEQGDPEALKWIQADEQAKTALFKQGNIQAEIDTRQSPDYLREAEENLLQARSAWMDHIEQGVPPNASKKEEKEWLDTYNRHESILEQAQSHFDHRLSQASPEELQVLKDRAEQRHAEAMDAVSERQGIAQLPSEQEEKGRLSVEQHLQQVKNELKPSEIEKARQEVTTKVEGQTDQRQHVKRKEQVAVL